MNKLESRAIPLLASPQGGVSASSTNFAKPPKLTQTGWFSFCSYRKTTPSSRSADASRYFLDRSATPPCGDARRGVAPTVALRQFFHRAGAKREPVRAKHQEDERGLKPRDYILDCRDTSILTRIFNCTPAENGLDDASIKIMRFSNPSVYHLFP